FVVADGLDAAFGFRERAPGPADRRVVRALEQRAHLPLVGAVFPDALETAGEAQRERHTVRSRAEPGRGELFTAGRPQILLRRGGSRSERGDAWQVRHRCSSWSAAPRTG